MNVVKGPLKIKKGQDMSHLLKKVDGVKMPFEATGFRCSKVPDVKSLPAGVPDEVALIDTFKSPGDPVRYNFSFTEVTSWFDSASKV